VGMWGSFGRVHLSTQLCMCNNICPYACLCRYNTVYAYIYIYIYIYVYVYIYIYIYTYSYTYNNNVHTHMPPNTGHVEMVP